MKKSTKNNTFMWPLNFFFCLYSYSVFMAVYSRFVSIVTVFLWQFIQESNTLCQNTHFSDNLFFLTKIVKSLEMVCSIFL